MNRPILVGTVAMVVCFAGFCSGAEQSPPNIEQLKQLTYFLGGWELTGEVNLAGQPRAPFIFERQFRWDLGNNFIQTTTTETKDGKTELRHRSMIGWEAKTQRITEWGFWNPNLPTEFPAWAETVTWARDDGKWRIEREGVDGLFTIIDQNTHTYECTFKSDDGSDNRWHFTAKRRPIATAVEAAQTALPDNIVKEFAFFVGEWTVEGDVLGMTLKGRWSAKWAPQKHCLLISYPLALDDKEIFGNGVMGWDAATKDVVIQMFYSNGVVENVRYTVESPGVFKGVFVGSTGGEASNAKCEARTNQPNEWTFKTTGHTIGGRQEGEIAARFVRTMQRPAEKRGK